LEEAKTNLKSLGGHGKAWGERK